MKFVKAFCSIYTTIVLLLIYGILCAVATFLEADVSYGTEAVQDLIYRTNFFNLVHIVLLINLIAVFVYRKIWQTKKYFTIILHVSFIVILFGAALTRFYGFEGLMHIRENDFSNVILTDSDYINIRVAIGEDIYYTNFPARFNNVTQKSFQKSVAIPQDNSSLEIKYLSYESESGEDNEGHEDHAHPSGSTYLNINVSYNGESKDISLPKSYLDVNIGEALELGGMYFYFVWGPAEITLPFEIYLEDFILTRYPGSNSPSSYKSKIQVTDYADNSSFGYEIFMNNVLDYKGYRFFQSSYDTDEQGTILSVNKDPGKIPTYIGYFLLALGFLMSFFGKNSRIWSLSKYLKSKELYVFLLAFSSLIFATDLYAQEADSNTANEEAIISENATDSEIISGSEGELVPDIDDGHIHGEPQLTERDAEYLVENMAKLMKAHSEKAGKIMVQDLQGRIKPLDTLATDVMHKLIKKDEFKGLNPVEMFLGMAIYSNYFQHLKMFPVRSDELKKILGMAENERYISFSEVFNENGEYKLTEFVNEAYQKNPAFRNQLDKDIIKFDEKMGISYYIYTGQMLLIFPDVTKRTTGFLTPTVASSSFNPDDRDKIQEILSRYFAGLDQGINENKWHEADTAVSNIIDFQKEHASHIIPSNNRIAAEILMNKYNPFKNLTSFYILLAIVMFIVIITAIIKNKPVNKKVGKAFTSVAMAIVIIHTLALLARWYVAGYAPWSNAYESMIYIAWASALAGLLFFQKSLLAIAATNFVAGISLFVANLGFMDPQIGTLVPVLKSYWLNIHVSVITASYSFFGLCFVLGAITLILFILRSEKRPHIDNSIMNVCAINEIAMILGLGLLTIGTFLGGVWANESWGRYWGWDPKETWSLITIIVYTIIIHTRLIKKLNKPYIFTVLSTIGFYSVLMTYFGVNFYLAGMHSYASGEPVPIPTFLYVMVISHIIIIALAFFKRKIN